MLKEISLNPALINTPFPITKNSISNIAHDNKKFDISLSKEKLEMDSKNELLIKMDMLLQDIEGIKEKIQEELTIDNVVEYRDSIKIFLNFYVDNMVGYEDVTLRHPKYGYSQKMTIVRNIKKEINELDDVMSLIDTKTGHLDVLNKIGEISGMILDLVL